MNTRIIPTTIFTGFLEAGKSSYIQKFLESDQTNRYEHILLLVCEEGEEPFNPERFNSEFVQILFLHSIDELSAEYITKLACEYRINRMLVEYNGMWCLKDFLGKLPDCIRISEIVNIIDAGTFNLYSANLRSQMVDKLRFSHRIIVNRANEAFDRDDFRRFISACTPKACIFYQCVDGELTEDIREVRNDFSDDSAIFTISDDVFPTMCRDIFLNADAFDGRKIQVSGKLIKDSYGNFAVGRYTMVCCMEDLVFSGFVCHSTEPLEPFLADWVSVEGRIFTAYNHSYGQRGPILNLTGIKRTSAPPDEIIF